MVTEIKLKLFFKNEIIIREGNCVSSPCALSKLITFCVRCRRRKMYCGHVRLDVCLWPYAHTAARTRMYLGGMVEADS